MDADDIKRAHEFQLTGDPGQLTSEPINDRMLAGLALLWQAYLYALDARANLWDFSLRTAKLYETGATISDLRWLVAKGLAEHAQETSVYGDGHRSFRSGDGFFFDDATCLVLTLSGAALADRVLNESAVLPQSIRSFETASIALMESCESAIEFSQSIVGSISITTALKPLWDAAKRELTLAGKVVKRFRVPARNQEIILATFEEESWPEHIDDPLPFSGDINPPTRLHDAINRLNGHQVNPLLRFHGNGNGDGVVWELRIAELPQLVRKAGKRKSKLP